MARFAWVVLVLVTACLVAAADASAQGKKKAPGKGKKAFHAVVSDDVEKQFKEMDKDGNWELSADEFKAGKADGAAAEKAFVAMDKDNNGVVTLGEFNLGQKKPAAVEKPEQGGKRPANKKPGQKKKRK